MITVVHPVKKYYLENWAKIDENKAFIKSIKWQMLKSLLRQVIRKGRVPVSYGFVSQNELLNAGFFTHYFCYVETFYLGRKTIRGKGIRHSIRKSLRRC